MKVVVFLGPPGAGKGTQCNLLNERLGIRTVSTGEVIRREIASKSDLGLRVKEIVEKGNLVEDVIAFQCLENAIQDMSLKSKDIILLDGIPRNLAQAEMMDAFLQKFSAKVNTVVALTADTGELERRFANRWTCSSCGYIDSITDTANITSYVCNKCGKIGTMLRRKDDDAFKKRFEVYQAETFPLISHYSDKKLLYSVNGLQPVEFVYAEIVANLLKI